MTMDYKGATYEGDLPVEGRDSDVWWCNGGGSTHIGTMTLNSKTALIYCVGEMRVWVGDTMVRYADQLEDLGITNDAEWVALQDRDDVQFVNNCWLEVMLDYDNLSIEIAGSLTEAMSIAYALLTDESED